MPGECALHHMASIARTTVLPLYIVGHAWPLPSTHPAGHRDGSMAGQGRVEVPAAADVCDATHTAGQHTGHILPVEVSAHAQHVSGEPAFGYLCRAPNDVTRTRTKP